LVAQEFAQEALRAVHAMFELHAAPSNGARASTRRCPRRSPRRRLIARLERMETWS